MPSVLSGAASQSVVGVVCHAQHSPYPVCIMLSCVHRAPSQLLRGPGAPLLTPGRNRVRTAPGAGVRWCWGLSGAQLDHRLPRSCVS